MESLRRVIAALGLTCLSLAPLAGHGVAEEPSSAAAPSVATAPRVEAAAPLTSVPLTSVVLYSSGLGHFVHDGHVEGDAEVVLSVPIEEINDFLKSLVIQDLGGGTVGVVRYGSREPLTRALQSFPIDLSGNPDIAGILSQARGEELEIVAERTLVGALLSVTTRTEVVDGVRREIATVNLNTAEGLQSIDVDEMRQVRFTNQALQRELREAVATLARDRTAETRAIRLHFAGSGRRHVRIGYVRQTPVWKTSYRLVLGDEPRIQAWAIVENTTGQDWENVSLSLVTGAPISFRMNLYDPIFIERPEVPPPVRATVGPQAFEQDLAPAPVPQATRSRAFSAAQSVPSFEAEERAQAMDLAQGVSEQSSARDLGSAFAYDITGPVTIERYASALVPIVNRGIGADLLSIYDQSALAGNPLLGAELENTTGVHLMPGPVTVFDSNGYAGDAQISDVAPGSAAYLSYGIDLDVQAAVEAGSESEELRRVSIVDGVLEAANVSRRTTVYRLSNRGGEARAVLIQHPKMSGWTLIQHEAPDSETVSDYRFRLTVPDGRSTELTVRMERVRSQTFALANLGTDRILFYVESSQVDSRVRQALRRVVELQRSVAEAVEARRAVEQEIQSIFRDQERIRANLEALESGSRLYDRYVSTLSDQEDRLEQLRADLQEAQSAEEVARSALADYLSGLTVS